MYNCKVRFPDGDIYEFKCVDLHSFCIRIWKYFYEYENMEIQLSKQKEKENE